ncbi:hypothetical protein EYE42_03155 [Paracoccus subflavus]|uniref:Uncharacterized protein n=1 Tax=Paracoccus subflavus TaxID=2528244 RepID=A0A4Q9G9Q9_9RHOB|nr:hypothetical protein [Paracoccus subflavus]TBN42439.1 hypothetical protein EYE42_03155 [Paracoccus subflavus]
MDRTQFIIATTLVLFGAFLLGWFASWLIGRLTRATQADPAELDRLMRLLRQTEKDRDAGQAAQERTEADLTARLAAVQAELDAAMDGLRESRAEIEELRDYIERKLARR